ncbi:hypothetical protein BZA05DRAFT_442070 [Tricharina praecox]|uniref:uncharacterized protein n=1 Tax=Tricharina praecox TaxID=43433 RepID=UPI00221F061C|nr:uncharacterized protein BZA05DRAFT_442070 [Tricharina praecox]KAI5856375.1 hypothetical protein BZA05DRAFT_442070 [Tricharina praecox]
MAGLCSLAPSTMVRLAETGSKRAPHGVVSVKIPMPTSVDVQWPEKKDLEEIDVEEKQEEKLDEEMQNLMEAHEGGVGAAPL